MRATPLNSELLKSYTYELPNKSELLEVTPVYSRASRCHEYVLTSDKLNGERRASPMAGTNEWRKCSMLDGNQGNFFTQDFSTG